jgi:hypothetical protein
MRRLRAAVEDYGLPVSDDELALLDRMRAIRNDAVHGREASLPSPTELDYASAVTCRLVVEYLLADRELSKRGSPQSSSISARDRAVGKLNQARDAGCADLMVDSSNDRTDTSSVVIVETREALGQLWLPWYVRCSQPQRAVRNVHREFEDARQIRIDEIDEVEHPSRAERGDAGLDPRFLDPYKSNRELPKRASRRLAGRRDASLVHSRWSGAARWMSSSLRSVVGRGGTSAFKADS